MQEKIGICLFNPNFHTVNRKAQSDTFEGPRFVGGLLPA